MSNNDEREICVKSEGVEKKKRGMAEKKKMKKI